jgi:hypothetical protein
MIKSNYWKRRRTSNLKPRRIGQKVEKEALINPQKIQSTKQRQHSLVDWIVPNSIL